MPKTVWSSHTSQTCFLPPMDTPSLNGQWMLLEAEMMLLYASTYVFVLVWIQKKRVFKMFTGNRISENKTVDQLKKRTDQHFLFMIQRCPLLVIWCNNRLWFSVSLVQWIFPLPPYCGASHLLPDQNGFYRPQKKSSPCVNMDSRKSWSTRLCIWENLDTTQLSKRTGDCWWTRGDAVVVELA